MSAVHALATRALQLLDPEDAHRLAIGALKAGLGSKAPPSEAILATRLGDLSLPNPIGLAPGFDKDAEVARPMLAAGFGFVECGTVTPLPQAGSPRPRLFRLTQDRAVINRMGFNNRGLEAFASRLAHRPLSGVVGANIGANKDSSDRVGDYVTGLRRLWGLCDYFTLNISSPNTPGLRALQTGSALQDMLGRIAEARSALASTGDAPVFLKVAPDLEAGEAEAIVETVVASGLQGVIVSNTTLARPSGLVSAARAEAGGLSGAPLMEPSTRLLREFHALARGRIVLIGAGGVASGADAYAKIRAGAAAVQLYSSLVFEGPDLVVDIRRDLSARLRADGFAQVSEAVGAS